MIHIFTPEMTHIGVIADYESLIFTHKFYEVGNFEMYININKNYTEDLVKFNVIQVGDNEDITGIITHRSLPLDDSGYSGETLFIKGITLKGLAQNRSIVPDSNKAFMSFSGNQEYIMKQFVYKNMINATDKDRNIPGVVLGKDKGLGKQDRWRGRYENLADKLTEIGMYSNLGWDIKFNNHKKTYTFDVLQGVDRTIGNSERSHVVFELEFGNILSREYTEDISNTKNVIYAGGQGDLEEKLIQKAGKAKGFKRIEAYQDFSNIEDVDELKSIAEQTILDLEEVKTFNVVVSTRGSYTYKEDYFLGDYVTVMDRSLNIRVDSQITAIKEIDEGVNGIEITFGKMVPTILDKINTTERSRVLDIPNAKSQSPEPGRPGEDGKDGVDGVGLEYKWDNTKLGIKREDESAYNYVNLKGDKGDKGDTGLQGKQGPPGKNGVDGRPGKDGSDGTDATVTKDKIIKELGYTPVNNKGDTINGPLNVINSGFPVVRMERNTSAPGNRYGAVNLVRSGSTTPLDGIGIGMYFKNNNSSAVETHSGFFGGALDNVLSGSEAGQIVIAPAWRGRDPYSRTDFTLTAISDTDSKANLRGKMTVDTPSKTDNARTVVNLEYVKAIENAISKLENNTIDKQEFLKQIESINSEIEVLENSKLDVNKHTWSELKDKPATFKPSGHNHSELEMLDTRSVEDLPEDIPNRRLSARFKSNSLVDNPPVDTKSAFSHIININGWNSGNVGGGGETAQIAVGDSLAIRQSIGKEDWGPWERLATNAQIKELKDKLEDLDIPEGVDLKPVYEEIKRVEDSKADVIEDDQHRYGIVAKNGRFYIKVL